MQIGFFGRQKDNKMPLKAILRQSRVRNFLYCPNMVADIYDQFCDYFRWENKSIHVSTECILDLIRAT